MGNPDENPVPDIVIFGTFSERGGIQRRTANNIKVWVAAGLRVQIVSYRGGVCFYPEELYGLVDFVDLQTSNKWMTLVFLWWHLKKSRARSILSTMHAANLIVARLAFLPRLPVTRVLSVPNSFGESKKKKGKALEKKFREIRRYYPLADAVVAISTGVRNSLLETIGLKGVPVPCIFNGSVTDDIRAKADIPVEHPWLEPNRSHYVVLTAGRLAEQKDQETLIHAVGNLKDKFDIRLIIIGEGPLREHLGDVASRYSNPETWFDLPGHQENPYAWMKKADCFVLCSLWEGFPNVLAEAMGVGVPVVATDFPSGARDILAEGRHGPIVPMRDAIRLSEAIDSVIRSERPRYDLSRAVEPFTAETSAHRYLDVFGINRPQHNHKSH